MEQSPELVTTLQPLLISNIEHKWFHYSDSLTDLTVLKGSAAQTSKEFYKDFWFQFQDQELDN